MQLSLSKRMPRGKVPPSCKRLPPRSVPQLPGRWNLPDPAAKTPTAYRDKGCLVHGIVPPPHFLAQLTSCPHSDGTFTNNMRMTDWEAGQAVRERLEPLGRTGLSIIYADKAEPTIAIKAAGFWLDGEMYDHAAFARNPSETFKREAAIYEALGPHPHILKCLGAAYHVGEETNPKEMEAWAVKLERAPHGCLRERILDDASPPMSRRLQLAVDLEDTLQYIHDKGVIWGDVSTRNVLVFFDLHIKLCDFAGSSLRDVYPELLFACEPRYWAPKTSPPVSRDGFSKELFALGTGICEITEWAVPYGEIEIEELQARLGKGEYPHVSEDNPVGFIIRKLWDTGYSPAKEAADALREVSARLDATPMTEGPIQTN